MKDIKNLTVDVTYRVDVCDSVVPAGVYKAIQTAFRRNQAIEPGGEYDAAYKWLFIHAKEFNSKARRYCINSMSDTTEDTALCCGSCALFSNETIDGDGWCEFHQSLALCSNKCEDFIPNK